MTCLTLLGTFVDAEHNTTYLHILHTERERERERERRKGGEGGLS